MSPLPCPLCQCLGPKTLTFQSHAKKTRYWHCPHCRLIFVDPAALPTREKEKTVYQYHQNSPEHSGYIGFLRRIIDPAQNYLTPDMRGLDYGCGPGPTLSVLLKRQGFACADYDPIFYPELPHSDFDFVFATESFEHFHSPATQMRHIQELLKDGGYLFIMTLLWDDGVDFPSWHYKNDPTHVSFYHRDTIDFICDQYGFKLLDMPNERVILLQKKVGWCPSGSLKASIQS